MKSGTWRSVSFLPSGKCQVGFRQRPKDLLQESHRRRRARLREVHVRAEEVGDAGDCVREVLLASRIERVKAAA